MKIIWRGSGPLNPRRIPKPCAIAHEKRPEMPEITIFYDFVKSVWLVPNSLNPRRTPKLCGIAHENDKKCQKSRGFNDFVKIVWRGPEQFKSTSDPKTVCYSSWKTASNARNHEFSIISWKSSDGVPKSRVFHNFVKIEWRGSGPLKSTSDPKTVWYNPRKRPEMPEITSF